MYIQLDGQNIYYQKTGKGKDLILLHGWGMDVSSFWPMVDFLKENFTLWLIDLPGFGKSSLPKKTFTITDYAKIIAEFIKKNHITKPVIFGHSYGGKIATKLACLFPDLIDKLILEASSPIRLEKSLFQILIFPLAKLGHFFLPDIFHLRSKARQKLYKKLESDYADSGAMKEIFLSSIDEDLTSDLSKIKHETLLIWGENDRAIPLKYGKKIYRLISNSKLVVLEDTGHFPHITNPERVAYYVKLFCE